MNFSSSHGLIISARPRDSPRVYKWPGTQRLTGTRADRHTANIRAQKMQNMAGKAIKLRPFLAVVFLIIASGNASVIKFQTKNERLEFDLREGVDARMTRDDVDADLEESTLNCPRPPFWKPAKDCAAVSCKLPNCRCSGDDIPGNCPPGRTPQMVVLSFQNAVHVTNINLYLELFEGRKNPNNCPATGTFFVSGKYTNFHDVQLLYSLRHEIGNNGAEESTLPDYWYKATVGDWCRQIYDNKKMLTTWAGIKECDIKGFRTPYLYMGGNTQFQAYENCHVDYDATRVALNHKGDPNLMWPYSYDTLSTQDCPIGTCPNASFPGIWQMPLEALPDPRDVPCADLEGCYLHNQSQVFNTLMDSFNARYTKNRAPMMIAISTAFLLTDYKFKGLGQFLDTVRSKKDVFLVSAEQALAWTKNPEQIKPCHCSHQKYPKAFDCKSKPPKVCDVPRTCNYDKDFKFVPRGSTGIIYVMKTCASRCPGCYPRLGDPLGRRC